ncbi:MAG: hypothetical protein IJZ42_13445 [Lachnospiraceae bacterium]|nr:hypothetical protein [Lachnospiraceae bacterium]
MKKINVTLTIDEDAIKSVSGTDSLDDAISQELGWLNQSGMSIGGWSYEEMHTVSSLNKTEILAEIMRLAKDELNKNGHIGYTVPGGKYHIFASVEDIGDVLNGEKLVYRIEPNILDENGCAEPIGDCTLASYNDFAELLVGCMWCLDQFEADLERQKGLEPIAHIEIDLGNRTLVAETGYEKDYKEIYVGLKEKDGTWIQDLAIIGQKYHISDDLTVVQDKGISVKVYADKDKEDYTHDFPIDIWEPEEDLTLSGNAGIDIVKLQEYLKEEMILEFNSEKECMDYFNLYDGQNFKSTKEMKEYQGMYGFGLDGKWYHISFDEALDVITDRAPEKEPKTSLESKIKDATSRTTNDATNSKAENERERE